MKHSKNDFWMKRQVTYVISAIRKCRPFQEAKRIIQNATKSYPQDKENYFKPTPTFKKGFEVIGA